jgi:hypothetical protein
VPVSGILRKAQTKIRGIKMNFLEAIKEIKNGKKIRRLLYSQEWKESHGLIEGVQTAMISQFSIEDVEANDWEIVEENETLSDKICYSLNEDSLTVEDVKEALIELTDYLGDTFPPANKKIKEIFGDKLI